MEIIKKSMVFKMTTLLRKSVFGLYILGSASVMADGYTSASSASKDTSDWECEYCVRQEGYQGSVTANVGNLSDDAYRFGNYNGVDDGTQLFLDADVLYLDDDAHYFDLQLNNLGLDSQALQSEYGEFGKYQLAFDYEEIPLRKFDQLVTPFNNVGSDSLTLPAGWSFFDGNNSQAATSDWSNFELGSDWKRIKLGWRLNTDNNFDYQFNYQQTKKTGFREFSAAQIWNASYLPLPLDHKIDQLDLRMSYNGGDWWGSFSYQLSSFSNNADSLRYQNPFTSLVTGSEFGEIATAPDNQAYKVGMNLNYRFLNNSWAKLHASYGQMSQDDSFLPYTTNASLVTDLPASDLNAEVDTRDLSLRLYSRVSSKFSVRAKYRYHEQNNKSDQLIYQSIVADSFVGSEATNLPYDYKTNKLSFGGDWRFWPGQIASIEARSDTYERNFSAIRKTDNKGLEGKLRLSNNSGLQLNIKMSRFERDASNAEIIDLLTVDENPLMQRYHQADRDEDKISVQLVSGVWQNFSASLSADYIDAEYINSGLGLQENRRINYGLDTNWQVSDDMELMLYYLTESIEANLAANESGVGDWFANNTDDIASIGVGLKVKNLLGKPLDLVFDFSRSDADSNITVTNGSVDRLPETGSVWMTAELSLNYQYSKQWDFQLSYQRDEFESDDYAIDGVIPGTINNLLTYGAWSNNYNVNYIVASFTYNLF